MDEGLRESIKRAEQTSDELLARAEKQAEQRTQKLRSSHESNLQKLKDDFLVKKRSIKEEALEKAETEIDQIKNGINQRIAQTREQGSSNKEKAIEFLLNKILE